MRQSEINEIKNKAVESAKTFPCERILNEAGFAIRKRGTQIYAECPYCGSKRGFSVTESKNLYHCFKCNEGGGPARLYADLTNTSFIEASLTLASMLGDVDREKVETIISSPDAYRKLTSDNKAYEKMDVKESEDGEYKAPPKICDIVYRHMLKLPEFILTPDLIDYLENVRHLSKEEIRNLGFFRYQKEFSIDKLLISIKKEAPNFTYNNFLGVPGFYFKFTDNTKKKGTWCFKTPPDSCLGIPLYDANGYIVALQMRYMGTKKVNSKYFYISSRYVGEKNELLGLGSSPGTPVHVFYPKNKQLTNTFYIGEGFFKMYEIAKEGYISLSIQGVNSISYVADEVNEILKIKNIGKENLKFIIVFDSDMYDKFQVLEAGIKFNRYIKGKFPNSSTYFLLWNQSLGKGYDDMKFYCISNDNNYRKELRCISGNDMEHILEKSCKQAASYFNIPLSKIKQSILNDEKIGSYFGEDFKNKVYSMAFKEKNNG